jgi:hypothetical protein
VIISNYEEFMEVFPEDANKSVNTLHGAVIVAGSLLGF